MHFALRRLLSLVVPVLLSAGCAAPDSSLTEPELAPGAMVRTTASSEPDLSIIARFSQPRSITIAWAKKWIGPEGGRLDFEGFSVVVPAGAVDKVTQFSIRLPVDPSGTDRVVAEFGPHGAQFATPLTIIFPYAGTSIYGSTSPTVVWWNPDLSVWEDMGATVTADGKRLQTTTPHFSEYGTTDRSGTVTMSGG